MRKFLLIILSILCICFASLGVACTDKGGESQTDSTTEGMVENETQLLNGFNSWSDVVVIYLDPKTFNGSMKINTDETYIVEGEASYKCYISGTFANQPNLKLEAGKIKNDITDVTEFGLYIYNANDYAFDVIITAYAGDSVVCAPVARAEVGANELSFEINRPVVQKLGQVITDYSISFSGLKGDSTFYIDNFHVKTTKEAVVIPEGVAEIITTIDNFTEDTAREDLEAILAKYNALEANDKQCVTNYERLTSLIMPYWLTDLSTAQKDDPKTLLYFDEAFGPLQVSGTTPGISSYAYSTDMKYENETGSLKVDFSVTSTNWVSLITTATTLITEEFIEFYVYNDSDQYKAMCVGWNVPVNANYATYMVLEPKTWTKITSKSDHLTNAGGSSGAIQICGLSDLTDRRACAPAGTMYFSSVIKKGAAQDIIEARVGEDVNTLFFFDRELGLEQASETGGVKELSKDTVFNGQSGALRMNYVGNDKATLSLMTAKYQFNAGDYVVMNVYVDLDADYLQLRLGTLYGTHCFNEKWTTVIIPAEAFEETSYFLLEALNDGGDYKPDVSTPLSGYVYFTKAKVYSAAQVKNMSEVEDTYEYNIGSTTFVGKVNYIGRNYGSYNYNPTIYGGWYDTKVALLCDTLRFYARSDSADNASGAKRSTVIGLELKEAVECKGSLMYIVASGLVDDPDVDDLYLQIFGEREVGHFASPRPVSREVLEDGYVRYCFDLSSYDKSMKYFRLGTGHQLVIPDYEAVMIRDVYFAEK